jgi:hypothetical protein
MKTKIPPFSDFLANPRTTDHTNPEKADPWKDRPVCIVIRTLSDKDFRQEERQVLQSLNFPNRIKKKSHRQE